MKVRWLSIPALAGVLIVALAATAPGRSRQPVTSGSGSPMMSAVHAGRPSTAASGSDVMFAFLARQHSNRRSLEPAALLAMSDRRRLQGSCCFPMDLGAYRSQVAGLRAYATLKAIPPDPYDISVKLAKQLLAYDKTIHLTRTQVSIYRAAMRRSHEKGPCCCHCWRWDTFRGLSNYVIARYHFTAPRLARVVDLVEGCGGPAGS